MEVHSPLNSFGYWTLNKYYIIIMIRRQIQFLGHVIRNDELENVVLTGYVDGTRDRGKQRETFLTYLSKHKGIEPSEMIRQAIYRDMWIQLCRAKTD